MGFFSVPCSRRVNGVMNGVRSLRLTQMLILEPWHDFGSTGGERFHTRRGDELPVTGDEGDVVGAGGGGDDAIGGIAVEIGNAVGVAGDFRGKGEELQSIEECLGAPFTGQRLRNRGRQGLLRMLEPEEASAGWTVEGDLPLGSHDAERTKGHDPVARQ